jgi:hypothetical protein
MAKSEEEKNHKYIYFVDGDKFENESANTTGAIIKSRLSEIKRGYALYEEGQGKDPDALINDNTTVSLEKGSKHFYTVPPASFGIA